MLSRAKTERQEFRKARECESVGVDVLDSSECEGLLTASKRTHLNSFAVLKREDIGQTRIVPFGAAFEPGPGVNEDDDLVAGYKEAFGFAAAFGPVRARLRKVGLDSFVAMIGAASRKFGRLGPLDLRVESFNGRGNIVAIECGIGSSERLGFGRKGRIGHGGPILLSASVAARAREECCDGNAKNAGFLSDGLHAPIVTKRTE